MVRGRARVARALLAAGLALVGLSGCDQPVIPADTVVTSFGNDGLFTLDAGTHLYSFVPMADGGFLTMDRSSQVLQRYDATGAPVAGWAAPALTSPVDFLGGLPDGSVLAIVTESSKRVVARWSPTGVRVPSATQVLPSTAFRGSGLSPFGNFATVTQSCAAGTACDTFVVDAFKPDGTKRYEVTVDASAGGAFPCSYNVGSPTALAHDDGTTTVAMRRCSAASGSTTSRTVVRRIKADGTVDATYGAGEGYGVIATSSVRLVLSHDKHVLAMTGSYGLSRLTPAGVPDTTFGTRAGLSLTGGIGLDGLIANGDGYSFTAYVTGPACDPDGLTTVRHLGPTGTVVKTVTTPVAVSGGNLLRYPNGDLLVGGVSQASQVSGTSTTCIAPRTFRYLKLTAPPAA